MEKKSPSAATPRAPRPAQAKKDRLAAALKANLLRRKAVPRKGA